MPWVAFLILIIYSAGAVADAASTCRLSGSNLNTQTQNLCELQCQLESSSASYRAPKDCVASDEKLRKSLDGSADPYSYIASCATGVGAGAWENLRDMLAPEQYQEYVRGCAKSDACRVKLARDLEQYRVRGRDQKYVVSDERIANETRGGDFAELLSRSTHNRAVSAEVCRRKRYEIIRSLPSDTSVDDEAPGETAQAKANARLADFDADCLPLLGISGPGAPRPTPTLTRAAKSVTQTGRETVRGVSERATQWLKDLGVSLSCLSGENSTKMVCYAVAKIVLDPLTVGGAGVFGARAMKLWKAETQVNKSLLVAPLSEEAKQARATAKNLVNKTSTKLEDVANGSTSNKEAP